MKKTWCSRDEEACSSTKTSPERLTVYERRVRSTRGRLPRGALLCIAQKKMRGAFTSRAYGRAVSLCKQAGCSKKAPDEFKKKMYEKASALLDCLLEK